jgi:hypothetical protein
MGGSIMMTEKELLIECVEHVILGGHMNRAYETKMVKGLLGRNTKPNKNRTIQQIRKTIT